MYVHILFKNDTPLLAYTDPIKAEDDRKRRANRSDGSLEQGIFHVKAVMIVGEVKL